MRTTVWRPALAGIGLLMLAGSLVQPARSDDRLPDRRVVGVAPSKTTDATLRENLVDLSQQMESLQAEVRQLRNTVEIQGHELEQLQGRQRALYDDLDKRLRETERHAAAAPAAAVPAADVPAAAAVAVPRTTTPAQQQEYDAAFGLMKQGLYDKAVKAFREFLAKNPNSGLADNAQYWIGEGNYVLRNYKLALEEYAKVLAYPQSPKTADALLKIGYVHYELGAFDQARKTLTDVQTRFPGTSVAKLAATRLEKMKKEGH
jgi:tol-pal system protein YbgF